MSDKMRRETEAFVRKYFSVCNVDPTREPYKAQFKADEKYLEFVAVVNERLRRTGPSHATFDMLRVIIEEFEKHRTQ